MSNHVKIALYVVLALLVSISGYFAFSSFGQMMDRAANRTSELEQVEPERKPADEPAEGEPANNTATTNGAPASTNVANLTNAPGILTNDSAVTGTNTKAATVLEKPAAQSAEVPTASPVAGSNSTPKSGRGRLGLSIGIFLVSLVALGLLIASDVTHFVGNRALKTLYNEEGEGVKNPEYENAEAVWASGKHLEAIGLMRDYLKKNPREQHVAIRIAEIYEKDLGNHLAAALEYEEVLNHKLPAERWGWSAIHLCNLYFKLGQEQKGYDLLRRLVKDHPQTPAADKARKRLEQVDGATLEQIATEQNVRGATPASPSSSAGPPSNLPPGFRPKK